MVSILKDQIILCTPSFPLFMWSSAVAKEEEEELGGVGYTRSRDGSIEPSKSSNACVITCKQLHLLDIGQGWSGQRVIWIRIEQGKYPPGLRRVAVGGWVAICLIVLTQLQIFAQLRSNQYER